MREPKDDTEISDYKTLLARWTDLNDVARMTFLPSFAICLSVARQRLGDGQPAKNDPTQGATHWVSPVSLDPFKNQKQRYARTVGNALNRAFPDWARGNSDPELEKMRKRQQVKSTYAEVTVAGVASTEFLFYTGVKYKNQVRTMLYAKTWLPVLLCFPLAWGCSDHRASSAPQTPDHSDSGQTLPPESPRSKGCETSGDCHDAGSGITSDAGSHDISDAGPREAPGLPGSVLSPSGHFALVWPVKDQVRYIEVHDVSAHRRPTRVMIAKEVVARPTSARVRWTAGDHILLSWSAGTNNAQGILYSVEGKTLLEVAASGMSLSPSTKYLATYPTLLADEPVIEVYDMANGHRVAEKTATPETFWEVQSIEWRTQQFLAHFVDNSDRPIDILINLNPAP